MRSYISSFNHTLIVLGLLIFGGAELLSSQLLNPVPSGMRVPIYEKLLANPPDLVMLGSSEFRLAVNLDVGEQKSVELNKQLAAAAGRPVKVFIESRVFMNSSIWYLIITQHILDLGRPELPVVLLGTPISFLKTAGSDSASIDKEELLRSEGYMRKPDPFYYKKIYGAALPRNEGLALWRYRSRASLKLLHLWLAGLSGSASEEVTALFEQRLQMGQAKDDLIPEIPGLAEYRAQTRKLSIEQSFLPELLDLGKKVRLVFVELPLQPGGGNPALQRQSAEIAAYVRSRGGTYLTLIKNSEISKDENFLNPTHLSRLVAEAASKAIAETLQANGLLVRPGVKNPVRKGN